ncbi:MULTISPECIES: cysteine-rich KTR domain-containing protein [unclassified Ruminococcus]|nr:MULTISPECIES: cysteine-rich KTR domain-containing protein [unclassified Ruminococcus]MCQ4022921.1 conjugal transfer protein [Ruminococcus sp. zg-924]MCQ4115263.1 conjugal transfer protein [Ruminococcus sp. zg-921]
MCPIYQNKTRVKIREDTEIKNLPLLCLNCQQETVSNLKQFIDLNE